MYWSMISFLLLQIVGLLLPNPTFKATIFWQWVNQSHNACVNYANRNATKVNFMPRKVWNFQSTHKWKICTSYFYRQTWPMLNRKFHVPSHALESTPTLLFTCATLIMQCSCVLYTYIYTQHFFQNVTKLNMVSIVSRPRCKLAFL